MLEASDLERLEGCLQAAAVETFELMCFTAAEATDEWSLPEDRATTRQIGFAGDASGQLCLAIDTLTARQLAANFYGQDEDSLQGTQVEALVAELTNVVCGGMLTLFAPNGSFCLSMPVLHAPGATQPVSAERAFRVDTGEVIISVACW